MIEKELVLQSERVLLRPVRSDDLYGFAQLTGDPVMWKYFTSDLSDPEELQKWVDEAVLQTKNGSRMAFTIVDRLTDRIAGSTSLGNISFHDKRVEMGWTWLGKEYQGQGINDQSKFMLIRYCFESLGFERVESKTDFLNFPARQALKRIGLTEEGILRSHTLMTHNRRRDTIYYSILKTEWPGIKLRNSEIDVFNLPQRK